MSITVAVVAMGEMGAGVAARLVQCGAQVITNLEGRAPASVERAAQAGVRPVAHDATLTAEADLILSIVPPASAGDLARRLLPAIRAGGRRPVYVDCNAIAPQTVRAIAAPFEAEGLSFVDAGIVGGPPAADGYNPRIYASGPEAEAALVLNAHGLDVRLMLGAVGEASALKMAYAGTTKGTHAVMIAMMLGAARAGVAPALIAEMADSQAGRLEAAMRSLPMVLRKAYRWDGEMEEIARFLDPEVGGAEVFNGAAVIFRDLARDFAEGPLAERMELLRQFDRS